MIDIVESIKEHFDSEYPNEGCGIVIDVGSETLQWIPSKNVSETPETAFEIEERIFVENLLYSNIVGIVHNHIDSDSKPSQQDLDACKAIKIPYWIFSYPKMKLTVIYPED